MKMFYMEAVNNLCLKEKLFNNAVLSSYSFLILLSMPILVLSSQGDLKLKELSTITGGRISRN